MASVNTFGVGAEGITKKIFLEMSLKSQLPIEMKDTTNHLQQVSNSIKRNTPARTLSISGLKSRVLKLPSFN